MKKAKAKKPAKTLCEPTPPWAKDLERGMERFRDTLDQRIRQFIETAQLDLHQVVEEIHTLNKRFGEGSYTFHQALQDVGYYKAKTQQAEQALQARTNRKIA